MQVFHASQELAQAAHSIIACGMATHLLRRATDLRDDTAVIFALAQAGFGLSSIRTLRALAVAIAKDGLDDRKVH